MRKSIFVGLVVACLVIVGTAVALAQQPSQESDQLDQGLRFPNEMHSWTAGDVGEMPMFGGSGVVGEDGWQQAHDEMHEWMTDNWDNMPMNGEDASGSMTDNWDDMPMHGGGFRG